MTILQALRLRGATVSFVTCDGVFSDCDLFQEATGAAQGREENSCLICQSSVAARLAAWNMPYRWLGTWLTPQDRTDVGRWLAELAPENYPEAKFNGWSIGAWVPSSVRTELRCNVFNMEDEKTAATYASYLYSGALAALGLDRLFEDEQPEAQLLFNGRMAPKRIALELALQRGIRTICEERAAVAGHLILFDNANCLDISHVGQMWEVWKDIPLTPEKIEGIAGDLEDRRCGGSGEVSIFSAGRQATDTVYTALNLEKDKPLWVLFTSSEDEIADKADVTSIFPNQTSWIEATIAYAQAHPEIQLVIRVHPNVGGDKALGENAEDTAYFEALAKSAPNNVRVVQPGDTFAGRHSTSHLSIVGLTDWIANNDGDYVRLASEKASDRAALRELRTSLRERLAASPICDYLKFTKSLERAYDLMWKDACELPSGRNRPRMIDVPS